MTEAVQTREAPLLTEADFPSVVTDAKENFYLHLDRRREESGIFKVKLGEAPPFYTVLRDELAKKIMTEPENFTHPLADGASPHGFVPMLPPAKSGPDHAHYRAAVQGFFNPQRVREYTPRMREIATEIVEPLAKRGSCDFQHDVGEVFPGHIMLDLFGLDRSHLDRLVEIENKFWIVPELDPDHQKRKVASDELVAWIDEQIEDTIARPNDSVINILLNTEVKGERLTPFDVKMYMYFFVLGGLHTTKALMGKMMGILAKDAPMRHRLTANPDLWPRFIEEALRSHALGESFRKCAHDIVIDGVQLKQGDLVSANWTAANRDPRAFVNPTEINLEVVQKTRHTGFGYGSHICMGMHLARADMKVMLEVWHQFIPDYDIPDGAVIREQSWAGLGVLEMPLRWDVRN